MKNILLDKELRITKLETQTRNSNRISIYIDDKFAFGLNKNIVYKFNIEEGTNINKEFLEKVLKAEEQKKANDYTIKLLSYRPRSEKEIQDKMKQKGYDDEVINKTLGWLKDYNYIDDNEFAKEYIKSKIKKYGSSRIKLELLRKGVNEEIINSNLNNEVDCFNEYDIALKCAKKKIKAYKEEQKEVVYRRLSAYLQRRGFSYDIIFKILKELV